MTCCNTNVSMDSRLPIQLGENSTLPSRSFSNDAGLDLYSSEQIVIRAGMRKLVNTGIRVNLRYIPRAPGNTIVGLIWDRSGLGSKGITTLCGVIDNDYTGEIKVCLFNTTNSDYQVNVGDRIAQLLIQSVVLVQPWQVEAVTSQDRGDNGFGSTGS